jgi:hypothetical protein
MERNALAAVLATLAVGAWGLACPSSANTDSHGAYRQGTGKFHCTGQVQDDGDGGRIFVEVRGREIRPEDDHFRTARVRTRLVVEERAYPHGWEPVKRSRIYRGRLGAASDRGRVNVSPFRWNMTPRSKRLTPPLPLPLPLPGSGDSSPKYDRSPTLKLKVRGHDDLFRARVVTRVVSDEGALLARLVTREGSCRL